MRGHRVSSGSSFEELASYSRAVVLPDAGGDWVMVSGTTGFDYAAMTISADVAAQTHQVFRNIAQALEKAGSSLNEVVRIRVYLAEAKDFSRVAPIIGQYMHAAMPANTTVVTPLVDERMRIEVEVTARKLPGD
jgi:enamine deaminase RidA (YjgF/YER057c/UK114 family)